MTSETTAAEAGSPYGKPRVERFGTLRECTGQYLLAEGNDGWFICGDGTATDAGGRTS
jgi:hypothetical protein